MKTKHSLWLALMLSVLLAGMPALAAEPTDAPITDLLEEFGLTASEAETFAALAAGFEGDISEDDIREMLTEFMGDEASAALPGQLVDGVYTDPAGYSMRIPEGWTLQEYLIGSTAVIAGPLDEESGFMPTITVLVAEGASDDFLKKTQAEIDALLSESLQNYLPVALDDFDFLDIPAREMVCMYGATEESMLMQYQLHFNNQGKAFIITMTTLAEEAAHEQTLDTYDAFLAEFVLVTGQGNG